MPGRDRKKSDSQSTSEEPPPDISNVREYSDMILYFVKSGRFQYHSLQDYGRRKGVISLLTAERVFKLTQERRLRPVAMQLTAGEVEQRVYLFSLVRSNLSQEELDDIIKRLNDHLEGSSTKEKEDAVINLIHNTGPRMIPGTRNLPFYLYDEGEEVPPFSRTDEDGKPITDLSEEVVAVKQTDKDPRKTEGYRSLPSTHAAISDPRTDSERSSVSSRGSSTSSKDTNRSRSKSQAPGDSEVPQKKAKGDKEQVPEEDDPVFEESQESPHDVTMTEEPGDNTQGEHDKTLVQDDDDMDTGDTAPPNADKTLVRLTSTDDPDTDIVHRLHSMVTGRSPGPGTPATSGHNTSMRSGGSDEPVTHGELNSCMQTIMTQLSGLQGICQSIVDFQAGRIGVNELAAAANVEPVPDPSPVPGTSGTKSNRTVLKMPKHVATASTSSEEPPEVYEAETRLMSLFPVNVYTPAMDWLLRQDIVHKYLFYVVMKRCYNGLPTSKPDFKTVIGSFFDYAISTRLACHLGKSTGRASGLQFGRFPMPQPFVDIAERNLASLHRLRVPGESDVSGLYVHRCNALKRNALMSAAYLTNSNTIQEMAQRLYWERRDFYNHHRYKFPHVDPQHIPFKYKDELKGVREWTLAKGKVDDVTYKEIVTIPGDIEKKMFPPMKPGRPLNSMDEARDIVRDLKASGLSKPRFAASVWQLINSTVEPTTEELAVADAAAKEREARHDAKNKHRHDKYAKSHPGSVSRAGHDDDEESDSEEDSEEEPHDDTDKRGRPDDDDGDDKRGPGGGAGGSGASPSKRSRKGDSTSGTKSKSPKKKKSEGHAGGSKQTDSAITYEDVFGSGVSDISSSPRSDIVATTSQDGQFVFIQALQPQANPSLALAALPEGQASTSHQVVVAQGTSGPGDVANYNMNDVLAQAVAGGLGVQASTNRTTNLTTNYEMMVVNPNDAIPPLVASGQSETQMVQTETLSRPPRARTPMEKYNDMEDDLPELSTSSSSSNEAKFSSDSNGHQQSTSSSTSSNDANFSATSLITKMGPPTALPWKAKTREEHKKDKKAKKESRGQKRK